MGKDFIEGNMLFTIYEDEPDPIKAWLEAGMVDFAKSVDLAKQIRAEYDEMQAAKEKHHDDLLKKHGITEETTASVLSSAVSGETDITDKDYFSALMVASCALDTEEGHVVRDGLCIELLKQLGYQEAAEIYEDAPAWYA